MQFYSMPDVIRIAVVQVVKFFLSELVLSAKILAFILTTRPLVFFFIKSTIIYIILQADLIMYT